MPKKFPPLSDFGCEPYQLTSEQIKQLDEIECRLMNRTFKDGFTNGFVIALQIMIVLASKENKARQESARTREEANQANVANRQTWLFVDRLMDNMRSISHLSFLRGITKHFTEGRLAGHHPDHCEMWARHPSEEVPGEDYVIR